MTPFRVKIFINISFLTLLTAHILTSPSASAAEQKFQCPPGYKTPKRVKRSDVYRGMPFGQGETAKYELRYFGALAGYGTVRVKKPIKHNGQWHRVFHAEAATGDWYKLIFVAHDVISSVNQPWDFGVAKFYMKQDEGKLFGKRTQQKKWIEFDHKNCKASERLEKQGQANVDEKAVDFMPKSVDTIGALFYIRTLDFEIGKKQRAPVYSSEKNWYMELDPVKFERIKTQAGEFDTVKVKVQTYIGDVLEQKGDVYAWLDRKSPERPLVRIEGDVKIGTIKLELVDFKSGKR